VFFCAVLFVSISQVIGCEDRLRNGLYCVGWGVKLYSNEPKLGVADSLMPLSGRASASVTVQLLPTVSLHLSVADIGRIM